MDAVQVVDPDFGQTHFGAAPLGDVRRVRLLVQFADRMICRPGASLPTQVQDPAAYQALLGLVNRKEVTHASVSHTHFLHTCSLIRRHPGTVLVLHDTTELDYTSHKSLQTLGQIGDGKGRGYECHNSLALVADTGEILGLANQILHHRVEVPKGEGVAAKRQRETRESLLWINGIAAVAQRCATVGPGSPKHLEVHVFDRGGDTFENLQTQQQSEQTYVGRSNHNRAIYIGHEGKDQRDKLHDYARRLPEVDRRTVEVPAQEAKAATNGQPAVPAQRARTVVVAIAFAAVQVKAPHVKRGKHSNDPMPAWVVRISEVDAAAGVEPLEWLLLTNYPVSTLKDACLVKSWYERRWTIEDYPKGQKTGCAIEKPQFTKEERLEPVIALLSVIAVWLLRLRWLSRQDGLDKTAAVEVVPPAYVGVLSVTLGKGRRMDLTAQEFFLGLARLGGYDYPRKGRLPGWLVLWRGWGQLQSRVQYALAAGVESLDAIPPVAKADCEPNTAPSG